MSALQLTSPAAGSRCSLGRRTCGARAARRVAPGHVVAAAQQDATQGVLDCVVVGGGVSGLCIAQALDTKHGSAARRLLVTEARDRVGGNITTVTDNEGYLWEEGPNSFQPSQPILRAAVDAGLKDELVFGDPTAPRFVWWEGKLRPVPAGLPDLPVFDLLSIAGKIRAGLGALGIRPSAPEYEESVEQFVRRNLGDEVFERLIEPFCSGVYAGDPSKLSMKAAFGKVWKLEANGGSIIGGTLKGLQERNANPPAPWDADLPKPKGQTVASFRKGLITFPNGLAARLGEERVKCGWTLTSVDKAADGMFTLGYSTPSGAAKVVTRSVVFTVPAHALAPLLRLPSPTTAAALEELYYPPVGAVTLAYPQSAIREDRLALGAGQLVGFGQLHPRSQGVVTLGTIYSSALFPGRAPPGQVLLLNYIGGVKNTRVAEMSKEALTAQVDADLRTMLLKPDAPPPRMCGIRVWPQAIPQFNVGHLDVMAKARQGLAERGWNGAFLGGNYAAGVALGRCVEAAYEQAGVIGAWLAEHPAPTPAR